MEKLSPLTATQIFENEFNSALELGRWSSAVACRSHEAARGKRQVLAAARQHEHDAIGGNPHRVDALASGTDVQIVFVRDRVAEYLRLYEK